MKKTFLPAIIPILFFITLLPEVHAQPIEWMSQASVTQMSTDKSFETLCAQGVTQACNYTAAAPSSSAWAGTTANSNKTQLNPTDFTRKELGISKETSLERFVLKTLLFLLGFLGAIMLAVMIFGGYKILIAQGEEEKYTQGRKTVVNAIIGFVIIILSYALVNTLLSSTSIFRSIFAIFGK